MWRSPHRLEHALAVQKRVADPAMAWLLVNKAAEWVFDHRLGRHQAAAAEAKPRRHLTTMAPSRASRASWASWGARASRGAQGSQRSAGQGFIEATLDVCFIENLPQAIAWLEQ